jgi:putative MFS transporter
MEKRNAYLAVAVSALGYFVDIYDLLLFSIVRVSSLKGVGVADSDLLEKGVLLINCQMAGLLLGGILWGILGDKKGRLSVLFGSIFLYSIANVLNGYVQSVEVYALLRFFAGIGLAGELGAGITLVSELLPKHNRGYGTTLVASFGILGAVMAALIGDAFDWRTAFQIGGEMGLILLILRVSLVESGLFKTMREKSVKTGRFLSLFHRRHLVKYLSVIAIGIPIWFTIGILITFSPEFGRSFQMTELPSAGKAVMYSYLGLSLGDLSSGWISQVTGNRKRVIFGFLLLLAGFMGLYFLSAGHSLTYYYFVCGLLGFAAGYWALFVTVASEQFGTNIRATVTTTAPNFVRGSVIPLTLSFQALKPIFGLQGSAMVVGAVCYILAMIALSRLEETFGRDLAFVEEHL